MKYLLLQEITDWEFPSNTYITDEKKQKTFGYFKEGSTIPEMFKKPFPFDTRYRKFKISTFST